MEEIHFKILQFLDKQTEPVREDWFPNFITSHYTHNTTKEGGLIHDLRVVLAATKQWINTVKYLPNYYVISDYGRSALRKQIEERTKKEKEMIEDKKMQKEEFRTNKTIKTWTIIGIILATLMSLFGYLQGWFS